jgi:ADP-heptose:LPS heptosyltransferase
MRTSRHTPMLCCRLAPPRHVLVLRALQLGDMLCAVPALRAFRAAWPDAEIVLAGLPWARAIVERFDPYFDGFREFPGYPGLREREPAIGEVPAFLAAIQAERFDLAVQLHGSGLIVNPLVMLLGAARAAGFCPAGSPCPDPETFRPWPERGLEIRRLLALPEFLGIPADGEHLEFPVREADRAALASSAGPLMPRAGRYVCIHPGASVPERRWPARQFAAIAAAMASRELGIVLTGTAGEAALARAVAEASGMSCLDLAGKTDLGSLAALLEGARLLICNDTGVSHVAAALGVPSVVISTGDNPERWAPIDRARHRVLCGPGGIRPDEVIREAEALLRAFPRIAGDSKTLGGHHRAGPLTPSLSPWNAE